MAGTEITGGPFYMVVAHENPSGSNKFELSVMRTGEPATLSYPGSPGGDFHLPEGISNSSAYLKGNSVIVSAGTVSEPEEPYAVQIVPGTLLTRITAEGPVTAETLSTMAGQQTFALKDAFDVQAYDAAGVTAGMVLSISSVTGPTVPLEDRLQWVAQGAGGVHRGATAPATSSLWIRDDGTTAATDLFYYDVQRGAWLSTNVYSYKGYITGGAVSAPGFFTTPDLPGVTMSATVGYAISAPMRWIGTEVNVTDATGGSATSRLAFALGGTPDTTQAYVVDMSTLGPKNVTGQNFSIVPTGTQVLSLAVDNAASAAQVTVTMHCRKVAS